MNSTLSEQKQERPEVKPQRNRDFNWEFRRTNAKFKAQAARLYPLTQHNRMIVNWMTNEFRIYQELAHAHAELKNAMPSLPEEQESKHIAKLHQMHNNLTDNITVLTNQINEIRCALTKGIDKKQKRLARMHHNRQQQKRPYHHREMRIKLRREQHKLMSTLRALFDEKIQLEIPQLLIEVELEHIMWHQTLTEHAKVADSQTSQDYNLMIMRAADVDYQLWRESVQINGFVFPVIE